MNRKRFITVLCCFALLAGSGCGGWHMRGTQKGGFGIKVAYLDADSAPLLKSAVHRELSYRGVAVSPRSSNAQAAIELSRESFDRRVLSVDPSTGKVREVELGLEVQLSIRAQDGKLLRAPERLNWVQDFVFDESSLLGTFEQETVIRRELAEDAAQTILRRLETLELNAG